MCGCRHYVSAAHLFPLLTVGGAHHSAANVVSERNLQHIPSSHFSRQPQECRLTPDSVSERNLQRFTHYSLKIEIMQNIKTLLLLFTVLVFSLTASAQTTYYYKLTKKKVNGVVSENVSGGQFITLVKNGAVCYESDKEGFSVNHGRLDYKSSDENGIKLYVGGSYYGSNSILLFKSDYSSFNIKVGNDVYVYKRATPPAGAMTCSLIRKPESSSSSSSGGYVPPASAYQPVILPSTTYPSSSSSSSTSTSSSSSRTTTTTPAKRECIRCHGTGRQEYEGVTFGVDTKYCNECHRTVSSGHYHSTCQLCHGKGYY